MDSRSFSNPAPALVPRASAYAGARPRVGRARLLAAGLVLALVTALAGCGRQAVRASEKEFLADRTMIFDSDGQEAVADEHIVSNREGAAGGRGTGGGGCGCN